MLMSFLRFMFVVTPDFKFKERESQSINLSAIIIEEDYIVTEKNRQLNTVIVVKSM